MMIFLAEITAYNLTTSQTETLRFCTGSGYIDNASGNYYEPRIEQPCAMRREIFGNGQIGGASRASYGELTLINVDGGLDGLADYAFDGRSIVLKAGDDASSYASFLTVLKATMQQAALEYDRVSIRLRDRQATLNKPVQALRFAGNNALPAGLEGVSDLKDVQKPLFYGRVANITPVLVNTSRLIYQLTTGALADVVNVFDKGAYLSRGADYSSQIDMQINAPSAGTFRVWKAGGLFRLGATPAGQITATAWEYGSIEDNTAAQIAYRLATGPGGISAGDTVAADYTTLDGQNAGSIGLVVDQNMTVSDALDQVCASVGAWWGFDQQDRFRLARFDVPSGSPAASFEQAQILSIERQAFAIQNDAVPVWRVVLNHDRNHTVESGEALAGVVPTDRRNWLGVQTRQSKAEDAAVKTAHPLAQEVEFNTLLAGAGYAQPEASRLLAMLKVPRFIYTVSVRAEEVATLTAVDLGAVVSIQHARFGLSGGQLFTVVAIEPDYQTFTLTLSLWG